MVWRIHFTADDLEQIQVRPPLGPLADLPMLTGTAATLEQGIAALLAALVGRNRAAVLGTIAEGCTTTELADRVGISLAAASQHASILRDAGLITTHRKGSAVLHILTPLGVGVLRAG